LAVTQPNIKERVRRVLLKQRPSEAAPKLESYDIRNQSRISSGIHEQAATADDLRGIDTNGFPEAGQGSFMGGPFPDRTTDPRRSPWDYSRPDSGPLPEISPGVQEILDQPRPQPDMRFTREPIKTEGLTDYWSLGAWKERAKDIARPFLPQVLQGDEGGVFGPITGAFQALEEIVSPLWGKTATIKGLTHLGDEAQEILKIRHQTLIDAGYDTATAWTEAWQGAVDAGEIPISEQVQHEFWIDPLWIIPPVKILKNPRIAGELLGGTIVRLLSKGDPDLIGLSPSGKYGSFGKEIADEFTTSVGKVDDVRIKPTDVPVTPALATDAPTTTAMRPAPAGGATEAAYPREVQRALEKSWSFRKIDRPGSVGNFIESLPGIGHAVRWLRPANTIPEYIQVARVASDGVRSDFSTFAKFDRKGGMGSYWILKEMDTVFGSGASRGATTNVRFLGTAEDALGIEGTVLDIAQRHWLYELTDAMEIFLSKWQIRNNKLLRYLKSGYGSDLKEFPTRPGGVFLPNLDVSDDLLKQLDITPSEAAVRGRGMARVYDTAADRMKADPDFVPETDIHILQDGMDASKSVMASREVFMRGAGGLTRTQAVDLISPNLRKTRDNFAKRVRNLQNKIKRAEAASTKASRKAKSTEKRIIKMDKKAVLLMDSIEALGDDLGPELPRLAKQVKELQKRSESLQSKMLHLEDVADTKAIKKDGLMPALEAAAEELQKIRTRYAGINLKGYTFIDKPLYRYYPIEDAKAIEEILKISDNSIVRILEDWRGTQFAGDLSPLAGIQLPLFTLFHPVSAVRRIIGAGKHSIESRDLMRTFREDTMAEVIGEDIEGWRDLAFYIGHEITAGNAREFSGGLLRIIPGFSRATESMYAAVLRAMKASYDEQLRILSGYGMEPNAMKAVAADMASKVVPMWNPSRLGLSPARAAAIRSVPTSVSFLLRPATLMAEATTGFSKWVIRKPLTYQERLAVRLMLTFTASQQFLAISSAVISAKMQGRDPWVAAERAINPMSPKFGDLTIGNRTIPIGGPFRGIMRAIVPRKVDWSPVPVPFGGISNYFRNRVGPGINTQIRLLQNRDYHGGEIRKGAIPEQILRGLLYEIEGIVPLTASSAISGLRRELPVPDIVEESIGQLFGGTTRKESVFQQRNIRVEEWAKSQGITAENGKPIKSWYELGPFDRDRFNEEYPDEVTAIKTEQERQARQGIPKAVARQNLEQATTNRIAAEEALVTELFLPRTDVKAATVDIFRNQFAKIQSTAATDRASTNHDFKIFQDTNELPEEPNKRALVQYYQAFDDSKASSGRLIYESLDENMASLEDQWTDAQKQYVEENTGLLSGHPPIVQEYLRDRGREDVKKWRLSMYEFMNEKGVLSLYREYQRSDDKKAFLNDYPGLRRLIKRGNNVRDSVRKDNFGLELILYKWGYIDTPMNLALKFAVGSLRKKQGGRITNRLAIDRESLGNDYIDNQTRQFIPEEGLAIGSTPSFR